METIVETGNVFVLGDNIDTDLIIPARYLAINDVAELGRTCLIDLIENLQARTGGNGVIVAGRNFGSGSSREHAPLSLIGAGVRCVVAESFARIFFRNAFNVGLPLLTCPGIQSQVFAGDGLKINFIRGTIDRKSDGASFQADPMEPFMIDLIEAGGLINLTAGRLAQEKER